VRIDYEHISQFRVSVSLFLFYFFSSFFSFFLSAPLRALRNANKDAFRRMRACLGAVHPESVLRERHE
jgi:hypothetical protein